MSKRRRFSAEFKAKVVLEMISGEKGLMEASREYEIKHTVLSRWKQEFLERAHQVFEQPGKKVNPKDKEIEELERMVGRMAVQLDIAKKVFGNSSYRRKGSDGS